MGAGGMMDGGWGFGMGFGLHGVWGILLWGLVIWAVVMLVRSFFQGDRSHHSKTAEGPTDEKSGARAILAERFAMGEINQDEYQKMHTELNQ